MRFFLWWLRIIRWWRAKKIARRGMVLFMLWFVLLGTLPLEKWNQMDTDAFMNAVAQAFSVQNQCSSEIAALINGEIVAIFGRCQNENLPAPSVQKETRL